MNTTVAEHARTAGGLLGRIRGGGGVPAPPNGGGASLANDDAAMNAIFFRRKRVQLVNTSVTTHLV